MNLPPHLDRQKQELFRLMRLRDLYQMRIHLAKRNYALKNDFEKNEVEILMIETQYKLEEVESQIVGNSIDFDIEIKEIYGIGIE